MNILAQVFVAFCLGWIIGFERVFRGRAASAQIYCLVCVTSCALTAAIGQPSQWYDGGHGGSPVNPSTLIASVLTGIGFLGAGIIVKSGASIRGLSTAASIWAAAGVGVLVGLGLNVAALGLTALLLASMTVLPWIEQRMPHHSTLTVALQYREGHVPNEAAVHAFLIERDLHLVPGSLSIGYAGGRFELQFVILSGTRMPTLSIARLSGDLPGIPHMEGFTIAQANRG